MAEISAKDVMNLRNRTGLPMMACKDALKETGGDVAAAEEYLRKKLKGKMETRTDRAAGEGRIAVAIGDNGASIVELRAESDFTAKNDAFVEAANKIAQAALAQPTGDVSVNDDMSKVVDDLRITTGENISVGRAKKLDGASFGSYVHHDGKTGVLLVAEGDISDEALRQICMHVTAAMPRPLGVSPDDIPADVVEKEKKFRVEQAIESGKPKEIAEKMVEGGMRKFFGEVALLEQDFVMDPAKKIKDVAGPNAKLIAFERWQVGETAD